MDSTMYTHKHSQALSEDIQDQRKTYQLEGTGSYDYYLTLLGDDFPSTVL